MDKINVLITEVSEEQKVQIIDFLINVEYINIAGEVESTKETFKVLNEKPVDVVLMGTNSNESGYILAEEIILKYNDKAIIIIESEFKEDTFHDAIVAGAKDVLLYPFTAVKLVDTIYRANELQKKQIAIYKEQIAKSIEKMHLGNILTVFSAKGGVGKTFLATNIAVALAKQSGKKVVLLDLDLDFGNIALALNIVPRFTISDVVDNIKNIDKDLIESYLIPHESGISILASNEKPQINEFINAEHIELILNTLKKSFDYIVIDMPPRLYDTINCTFVLADNLFMVTTPEISAIRNLKSTLITLKDLNYPKSKIKIILNRFDSMSIIKPRDIEDTLGYSIYGSVKSDYKAAITSLNEGIPVVQKNKDTGIGKEIMDIARKYIQQ